MIFVFQLIKWKNGHKWIKSYKSVIFWNSLLFYIYYKKRRECTAMNVLLKSSNKSSKATTKTTTFKVSDQTLTTPCNTKKPIDNLCTLMSFSTAPWVQDSLMNVLRELIEGYRWKVKLLRFWRISVRCMYRNW